MAEAPPPGPSPTRSSAIGREADSDAEEKYRAVLDRIDRGFCIVEVRFGDDDTASDYRFLEVNPAFEEQTGLVAAEGEWMRDLAPDHEEHWFETYGRVARTREAVRFQNVSSELQRHFDVYAFPIGPPEGHRVGILFSDITLRKRYEDELRDSQERLQAAVLGGDLGVWDLDLKAGMAVRSPRHDEIWGYPEPVPEWSLDVAMQHVVPQDRPIVTAAFERAMKTGVLSHENRIVRPDGRVRWIAANGHVRFDAQGNPERITGVVADVTERREAEEAMRRAKDAAEYASQAKSQFLAVTSHELRTPLNAIVGFQELLSMELRGPVSEGQREFLDRIKESAGHLLEIIDEILAVSRIEAGTEVLNLTQAELGASIRKTASLLRPRADEKGLGFRVELPPEPVHVTTDVLKVSQILLNLLSNAFRFTDRGEVLLRVYVQGDQQVCVDVTDTGPGIPEDRQEWIFEPFTQMDQSKTRRFGGTGLGLSIARSYARLLAGDLHVRSEPGEGSTFTLTLPRTHPGPDAPSR